MTATMVEDARPPLALVRAMNPVMRVVLRTPVGRLVRPFALLEFEGRRSGRRLRVPVGWQEGGSGPVVVTPASWRVNFRDGGDVTVWFHGRRQERRGLLVEDPASVAETLRSIAGRRGSLRTVGVRTPPGHQITAAEVVAVDRAVIRFDQLLTR